MSDEISLKQWANRKWTSNDKYKDGYNNIFRKKCDCVCSHSLMVNGDFKCAECGKRRSEDEFRLMLESLVHEEVDIDGEL